MKRERPESERYGPEEIGTYPGGAGVASLVEARELDDPVWAALAAARPLGVLSVLLGWSPGLGASLLLVISAALLRGMKCGITRVPLTRFTRSWDRAILTGVNTWVNLGSDPVSCSWMIPVPVSAGIACHRL